MLGNPELIHGLQLRKYVARKRCLGLCAPINNNKLSVILSLFFTHTQIDLLIFNTSNIEMNKMCCQQLKQQQQQRRHNDVGESV